MVFARKHSLEAMAKFEVITVTAVTRAEFQFKSTMHLVIAKCFGRTGKNNEHKSPRTN